MGIHPYIIWALMQAPHLSIAKIAATGVSLEYQILGMSYFTHCSLNMKLLIDKTRNTPPQPYVT